MQRIILLSVGFMLLLSFDPPWAATVHVKETWLEIPTYPIGPEDKNPPLWNLNIYPYPRQDDIARVKKTVRHRILLLENDYLRLLFLPDFGGRLYAAHDKTNQDFDFIYHNHVIRPHLVALRGAWLSGGIEWNFPTIGHTVNTVSPVPYTILRNKDSSVTVVVGTTEWVRRMRWVVFTTLYPDRAYLENKILLINPTTAHNTGYFWVNAAVHAWPDTQIVFPPTDYTYNHFRDTASPWPLRNGIDISWYKNIADSGGYFCGVPGDFNGVYNHERDCGTVHWADRFESPGKKFWTWGTARKGALWGELLTENDGQYIEIQSGRLPTQSDTWVFGPQLTESWKEYWYPVKKMRGLVNATPDAALNFKIDDNRLFLALNTTRTFKNARLILSGDKKQIYNRTLTIDPHHPFSETLALNEKAKTYVLTFSDNLGREILQHTTEKEPLPPPALKPALPAPARTAEELYLVGYDAEKSLQLETAIKHYQDALTQDPTFLPALRALGIVYYQLGQYEKSRELFNKIMKKTEDDDTARYYRALCNLKLHLGERTEEDLSLVGRKAAWRSVVAYVRASIAVSKGKKDKARELLSQAVEYGPDNTKARVMLAAMLRHQGHRPEGLVHVHNVLRDDPLNPLAMFELAFLTGKTIPTEKSKKETSPPFPCFDDPQNAIEAACDYAEMNLISDALATLELYLKQTKTAPHPMVYFYLGYYRDKLGKQASAREAINKGVEASPDYVFPFRTEDFKVLETALRYRPTDWRLHYYLGNLFVAKLSWVEGLRHYEKARELGSTYSVLYRNLGEVYAQKLKDTDKAIAAYEKALRLAPEDVTLYVALDRQYALAGQHDKRAELFKKAPPDIAENPNVILRRAHYLVDTKNYDEALKTLRTHTFHPAEGWWGARLPYVLALHGRADQRMKEGRYPEAIADLKLAMEYPENLGIGKPPNPDYVAVYYKLGLCYKALRNTPEANAYFEKAAAGHTEVINDLRYQDKPDMTEANLRYQAEALKELGRTREAETLLRTAAENKKERASP